MKWIYGKQDFKDIERGQENCFLMTNALGGFSSMTMLGSAARNDHAVMMACIHAPNQRYNVVHRLRERVYQGGIPGQEITLSTQEFADGRSENGYEYLSAFTYEDYPAWTFQVNGTEIRKEMGMAQGVNTVAVRYRISNRRKEEISLEVTPFFQFVPKGEETLVTETDAIVGYTTDCSEETEKAGRKSVTVFNGLHLTTETNGTLEDTAETEEYFYSYDACDGRKENGLAWANQKISIQVPAGGRKELEIIFRMENEEISAGQLLEELVQRRRVLADKAGFRHPLARALSKSASQFVAKRESTGGDTILAGYPFFEDWGRDTMIALPGVCISTGQYESAKSILRTFAAYERGGLMPNLFPEGKDEPLYNTADAALLFINSVYLYEQATKDLEFVTEMYPVMRRVIEGYQGGTEFGICMDADGLIRAGEGLWQVTWMDVRVGEILPTPRQGKAVEINAYWYNALCIMEKFAPSGEEALKYHKLAEKVRKSFVNEFWMEERGCLKDLISGTKADEQIRCNQIWAVSMPFTMLEKWQETQVVETVFEKLYTPYGLRTLAQDDEEFHPFYGGPVFERDLAYHQGTVWTFPLGAYYLAYLKVNDYSDEAKETVWSQLEVVESALREGCIGQLPEIYDGKNPCRSKGCFAQAWSVGEILRVYEALEK